MLESGNTQVNMSVTTELPVSKLCYILYPMSNIILITASCKIAMVTCANTWFCSIHTL